MPSQQLGANEQNTEKNECLLRLRKMEVIAYHHICGVFRAQGRLTPEKLKLLKDVATALYIPDARHRAECRLAVNDNELTTIADSVVGPNTDSEWRKEGQDIHTPFHTPQLFPSSLGIADAVSDLFKEAFREMKKTGQNSVKKVITLQNEWFDDCSDDEDGNESNENESDCKLKEKQATKGEKVKDEAIKDEELSSSVSSDSSDDSVEDEQKVEDSKTRNADAALMPPPPPVITVPPSPPTSHPVTTVPPPTPPVITISSSPPSPPPVITVPPPPSPPVITVPPPGPVITVPPPSSITVIPATNKTLSPLEDLVSTSDTLMSSVSQMSYVSSLSSEIPGSQSQVPEPPIISESDDIQFVTFSESLPPLVVVPPAEPVITVPHSSSFSPPLATSTLVLPSGMSIQLREDNSEIRKRKRSISQESGFNSESSASKSMTFSKISKMAPITVSTAHSVSQGGQVKVTPIISRSKMAAAVTSLSTALPSSTQKVIIVSNASSSNSPMIQRTLNMPVGPLIRTGPPRLQSASALGQTSSGMTKLRPKLVTVPAKCRAKSNPLVIPNLQLKNTITVKQDNVTVVDTSMKRHPAGAGPAKILPKPQGSMFIVNSSQGSHKLTATTGGSQTTRLISPRMVTQSNLPEGLTPTTLKPVGSKPNVVILQKGGGNQRALTFTNTSKDLMQKLMSKKCVVIQSSKILPKNIPPKPSLPVVATSSGSNVLVLDLSQEQYRQNLSSTTIAEILQASGINPSSVVQTSPAAQNTASDEVVELLSNQQEQPVMETEVFGEIGGDTSQMSMGDASDQIFSISPEELAASEIGFVPDKMPAAEPVTSQIVIETLPTVVTSAMESGGQTFLAHRDGAVTIQHSDIDMPTNMSLEEYSSQQMENQTLN